MTVLSRSHIRSGPRGLHLSSLRFLVSKYESSITFTELDPLKLPTRSHFSSKSSPSSRPRGTVAGLLHCLLTENDFIFSIDPFNLRRAIYSNIEITLEPYYLLEITKIATYFVGSP